MTAMQKQKVVLFTTIISAIVLISGCTGPLEYIIDVLTGPPTQIAFVTINDTSRMELIFVLLDEDDFDVAANGHVKIEILDDKNDTLYYDEFDVKAEDYVEEYIPSLKQYVKEYRWYVPYSFIKKGSALYGIGTAILTFTTEDGRVLIDYDKTTDVPIYDEEEFEWVAENTYNMLSHTVGTSQEVGNISVRVTRAGEYQYYLWGYILDLYRVDFEIKNLGNKTTCFDPPSIFLVDKYGNEYEIMDEGILNETSRMLPGEVKEGYILFEDVPDNVTSLWLKFNNDNDIDYFYTIKIK